MADRYTYLPSLGPFLIAGLCVAWIGEKASTLPERRILIMTASTAVAIFVFLALAYGTFQQISVWKDGFVLWNHVIAQGYESATAYNNRGLSFDEMGQQDKAMADFERAIALDPRNYFAYNNRGMVFGRNGQYQRSVESFLKAIAVNPKHADSYCNLGLSYFYMGHYDRALENYTKAIELKRDFDMANLKRGNLHFTTGNKELALADYQKACSLGNGKACEVLHLATGGLLSR
jgi:tetratricopeptide (TPR) repeat protein